MCFYQTKIFACSTEQYLNVNYQHLLEAKYPAHFPSFIPIIVDKNLLFKIL
jgi:hypothetical protein